MENWSSTTHHFQILKSREVEGFDSSTNCVGEDNNFLFLVLSSHLANKALCETVNQIINHFLSNTTFIAVVSSRISRVSLETSIHLSMHVEPLNLISPHLLSIISCLRRPIKYLRQHLGLSYGVIICSFLFTGQNQRRRRRRLETGQEFILGV